MSGRTLSSQNGINEERWKCEKMNVEFVADHVQIWKNEEGRPDYDICFTRDGVYVTIGMSGELMEHFRQWINNIQSSKERAIE